MSIFSNFMKSPVIGGIAQQFNANADFRRKQDAEKESADYQFGKNIELADYKFKQAQKQAKEERTFLRGQEDRKIASREKIAAGEITADQAKIVNFVDVDLTKYGLGKHFKKMPNVKNLTAKNKAAVKLQTFYEAFTTDKNSYSEVLNSIFNNESIPTSQKDGIASIFMRNYKQTLSEKSYPGEAGKEKEFTLNADETRRVQDIPYLMERIARHFDKDVSRIQNSLKEREPLVIIGNQVEPKVDNTGKITMELPSFSNVDDQGAKIYTADDEVQIAMHIENKVGPENLSKDMKFRKNQVIQIAKAYNDKALAFNDMNVNGGVVLNGSDLSRAITGVISATKGIQPGQSIDSDPAISVNVTKVLKDTNVISNPAAVAFVIEQAIPRHIRNPRYRISTSQINENDHMKQLVLGKEFKILDLNSEFGSLQQMKTDAGNLVGVLRAANEKGDQTYTGSAAAIYKNLAGAKDQFRQILSMLPKTQPDGSPSFMRQQLESFINDNQNKTFSNPEVAKIAIANYYATVLSFRLATIVQTPPGGAATSVRISDKDRDALAEAIQQNIMLSIQNNNTVPLELILRETEQRIEIVRNLMSGDRRKVVAAKLMRNGVYATQGLYTPVQQLIQELSPSNGNSGRFINPKFSDSLVGGDIDVQINSTNNNANVNKNESNISPNKKVGGTRTYN
tara:strand:- start:4005 stop:6044 length:2040 start_codon:yes stop_codon:yes gene_type:complete